MRSDPERTLHLVSVAIEESGTRCMAFSDTATREQCAVVVSEFESFDIAMTLLSPRHKRFVRDMLYRDRQDEWSNR